MLDLDAAVQLEEEEGVALDHELDGSGAAVADRLPERDRSLVEGRAEQGGEAGGRRLLEHLLMTPLDGTVALADSDDVTVRIGKELHLHVPWPLEVALAVEGAVAERAFGLPRGGRECVVELCGRADDAHPAPASACGRLHQQREADVLRRAVRENGNADLAGDPLRCQLVSAES